MCITRPMSDASLDFKISRAGKVIHENLTLAQVAQGVASKSIQSSDHYWFVGMTDWALISSRQWVAPSSVAPAPAPAQVPTPASKPTPVEKGFSPYATFYRSNDDRWVFGILGGLAHRYCWPKPLLLLIRILILIAFLQGLPLGIRYLGWGFMTMLLIPLWFASNVRSYYDLNTVAPLQDTTDFSRLIKILVVGFIVLVFAVLLVCNQPLLGWLVNGRYS